MPPRYQSALLGLVILAVGVVLGFKLAERPLPPLGFLGGGPRPAAQPGEGKAPAPKSCLTPVQRQAFDERLAALHPQVEAFQKSYQDLGAAFHDRFATLLTDAQRAKLSPYHESVDWVADFNGMAKARLGETGLPGLHDGPDHSALVGVLRIVMYEPSLRIVTEKYSLTPEQQTQTRALMEERRQAFLRLTQDNPLPIDRVYFLVRDIGLLAPKPPQPGAAPASAPAPAR